ncbi:hypothetical protein F2P81_003869 [Scophthalmus maximus]|uniref:Uncharacterized protein n=1 Tax=Scophthalmus maximus TaxID=52904 RepID=A0A6A4TPN0_SCOMX|nr:hypothetical protein F2P81_003869 [Scophthalmus maximus]
MNSEQILLKAETTELVRPPSDHVSPPAAEKCIDVHSMVRFVCDNAELQCACMNLVNTPVNVSRCNVQVLEIVFMKYCDILGEVKCSDATWISDQPRYRWKAFLLLMITALLLLTNMFTQRFMGRDGAHMHVAKTFEKGVDKSTEILTTNMEKKRRKNNTAGEKKLGPKSQKMESKGSQGWWWVTWAKCLSQSNADVQCRLLGRHGVTQFDLTSHPPHPRCRRQQALIRPFAAAAGCFDTSQLQGVVSLPPNHTLPVARAPDDSPPLSLPSFLSHVSQSLSPP